MKYLILLFISCLSLQVLAQKEAVILLKNPSLEDMHRHSKQPRGWVDCGDANETPPDVHPSGDFEVTKAAVNGKTYLGLVVRDNDTWEAVGQRLSRPIKSDNCYEFSLHLAQSKRFVSTSPTKSEEVNYSTPAKVRIWGGDTFCNRQELLDETSLIINKRWLEYNFRFEPKTEHQYIIIEAYYKTPTLFPYNGNVLIDNASDIIPVPCEEPLVLKPEEENTSPTPTKERTTPPVTAPPTTPRPPVIADTPKPAQDNTTLGGFKRTEIKKGQKIKLERLYFDADKDVITSTSYEELEDLYQFLRRNTDVVIEIGGHTNSTPSEEYCDKLSTSRAKAVADYLTEKGIHSDRLKYKGYGKRLPIASNRTVTGRKRNQRVEIKVLGFNG